MNCKDCIVNNHWSSILEENIDLKRQIDIMFMLHKATIDTLKLRIKELEEKVSESVCDCCENHIPIQENKYVCVITRNGFCPLIKKDNPPTPPLLRIIKEGVEVKREELYCCCDFSTINF